MVEVINRARTNEQLRTVRSAQKKVQERIKKIKQQLKRLESEPGTPPWITFQRVQTVEQLQSHGPTLRQALRQDLALLKSHLKDLGRKSSGLQSRAAFAAAHQASEEFKKRLDEVLKEAEKSGQIPDAELASLRTEAEGVVKKFVDILKGSPTEKNMERVLEELETPLVLGSNIDGGVCGDAMNAVARASEKIVAQKEKAFRKNPKAENLDKLLQSKETAQRTGGHTADSPDGWKPANTTHPVAAGDTLSGISAHYYGDQGFWDVIYMENYGQIGDDVRQLRVGITLRIP